MFERRTQYKCTRANADWREWIGFLCCTATLFGERGQVLTTRATGFVLLFRGDRADGHIVGGKEAWCFFFGNRCCLRRFNGLRRCGRRVGIVCKIILCRRIRICRINIAIGVLF